MDYSDSSNQSQVLLEDKDGSHHLRSDHFSPGSESVDVESQTRSEKFILIYKGCVLACIMCLTFGSYWVFDTPGAIPTTLKNYFAERGKSLSDSQTLTFYSVYSWPNTVLALFGGMIVDRITGLRVGAFIFTVFITLGEALFAVGILLRNYYVALAGRFVFGLGGESLTVVQNSFTVKWFTGKYLALAFGSVVSFARVGSSVNFVVTPSLAEYDLKIALFVGVGACVLSLCVCLILSALDLYAERKLPYLTKRADEVKTDASSSNILKDIAKIPIPGWILNLICMFFYIGVLTFNTVASKIMQNTGNKYSEKTATLFLSIPSFVSIFASPTFGLLVDRCGRAMYWMIAASCMMICSQLAFLGNATEIVQIHPIPVMVWQGIGYAMGASAIWPSLSHVVPSEVCATAYGIMTSIQNIGMAFFPLLIGQLQGMDSIKNRRLKYTIPIMIFMACEIISLVLAVLLLGLDRKLTGGRLNATHEERRKITETDTRTSQQLEASRKAANEKINRFKRVSSDQAQLLVRDVMTSRSAYYSRLGVVQPPGVDAAFVYRPHFL